VKKHEVEKDTPPCTSRSPNLDTEIERPNGEEHADKTVRPAASDSGVSSSDHASRSSSELQPLLRGNLRRNPQIALEYG
jgi:hypothetical protein